MGGTAGLQEHGGVRGEARFPPCIIIFLKILLCHLQSLEMVLLEKQHKF